MYKLQIIDAFTREKLFEEIYWDLNVIGRTIKNSTNPKVVGCMFTDREKKMTYSCKYVSHSMIENGDELIFRFLYKTKIAKKKRYV